MISKLSLRFTHTQKKISWEEKSQYYKISGARSSQRKMVWQPADFRPCCLLMTTLIIIPDLQNYTLKSLNKYIYLEQF